MAARSKKSLSYHMIIMNKR